MEQFCQQLVNGLMIGSTYAVVALGFGLMFSVMRVVNLAHPEVFMVGAYVAFVVVTGLKVHGQGLGMLAAVGLFVVVLVLAMVATGVVGLVLERLVIRPTRGTYILTPFIATSGVSIVLQNGAQRIFGPDPVRVPSVIPAHTFAVSGVLVTSMPLTTVLTAVVIMLALRYYVHHTRWGRATRAVAEKPDVAAACIGVLLSLVTLRMNELVAGLTTLAFGETMVIIAFNLDYIGGANGFIGIPLETTFAVVYLILALVVFIAWRFDRSRLGYAARACRDNVHGAAVMGINTAWVKTLVFALGGSIAGIGGVLRAHYVLVQNPDDMGFFFSVNYLIFWVFGGSYTLWGPVFGIRMKLSQ